MGELVDEEEFIYLKEKRGDSSYSALESEVGSSCWSINPLSVVLVVKTSSERDAEHETIGAVNIPPFLLYNFWQSILFMDFTTLIDLIEAYFTVSPIVS